VVAFARVAGGATAITAVGRFFTNLGAPARQPIGVDVWKDTAIVLPDGLSTPPLRDVITDTPVDLDVQSGIRTLRVSTGFSMLPALLLMPVEATAR